MIDDKELDKLLSAYNPHIQGGEDFMQILSQKMAAVDMVMQYKEREEKAYRRRSNMCLRPVRCSTSALTFICCNASWAIYIIWL